MCTAHFFMYSVSTEMQVFKSNDLNIVLCQSKESLAQISQSELFQPFNNPITYTTLDLPTPCM